VLQTYNKNKDTMKRNRYIVTVDGAPVANITHAAELVGINNAALRMRMSRELASVDIYKYIINAKEILIRRVG
jgi:hypothetical protein